MSREPVGKPWPYEATERATNDLVIQLSRHHYALAIRLAQRHRRFDVDDPEQEYHWNACRALDRLYRNRPQTIWD